MILSTGLVIAERYEILETLGSGGMAIVYKAKDLKLDRCVTFKVMREEFQNDEEFISRFNVEAHAAASLSNQNIVNVYDVGQEGWIHYIVMEYIDGVTLKDLIKNKSPFQNDEILGVAVQIATALDSAHKNGIIHRDIKPQNIMVTSEGIVKVTDFGIARAASSSTLTTSTNSMGSVHYFSPEQARGTFVDNRSDIYSLGIVMFEMATGTLPFDGETPIAIALKQISDPLPDIKAINPNITDSIINIILKATEKNHANRYQSVDEMANDLKRAITNVSGDFVNFNNILDESPTLKLSSEELELIKKVSKSGSTIFDLEEPSAPRTDAEPIVLPLENSFDEEIDDEEYYRDKNKERKVLIAAVAVSIVIILLIIAVAMFIISSSKKQNIVDLPDLVGMDIIKATTQAADYDVTLLPTTDYSDTVPKGSIISVDLGDDGVATKGEKINVIVSSGPGEIEVPDLVNKTIQDATNTAEDAGIKIETQYKNSDDYAKDIVFEQDPPAGETIAPDQTLTMTVSSGPKNVESVVPNVVGKSEADAINILQSSGFTVGNISKTESKTVPEGYVVSQSIDAGEILSSGATITFVESSGAPKETSTPQSSSPQPSESSSAGSESPSDTSSSSTSQQNIYLNTQPGTIPDGVENVEVKVISSSGEVIYDQTVPVGGIPSYVSVTGDGEQSYQIYYVDPDTGDNYYRDDVTLNF